MRRLLFLFAFLLLAAGPAFAQTTWTLTTRIAFDHDNANFDITEYYEIGYFVSTTATEPVTTVRIPKSSFTSELPEVRYTLLPRPTVGTFYIRAFAGNINGRSEWSNPTAEPVIFGPDGTQPPPTVPSGITIRKPPVP